MDNNSATTWTWLFPWFCKNNELPTSRWNLVWRYYKVIWNNFMLIFTDIRTMQMFFMKQNQPLPFRFHLIYMFSFLPRTWPKSFHTVTPGGTCIVMSAPGSPSILFLWLFPPFSAINLFVGFRVIKDFSVTPFKEEYVIFN